MGILHFGKSELKLFFLFLGIAFGYSWLQSSVYGVIDVVRVDDTSFQFLMGYVEDFNHVFAN
jgi:hypothetical protein